MSGPILLRKDLTPINIKKALQDKYGFIWLATQDGVYRYDGTNFESFRKSSDADINIRENFITDIALEMTKIFMSHHLWEVLRLLI